MFCHNGNSCPSGSRLRRITLNLLLIIVAVATTLSAAQWGYRHYSAPAPAAAVKTAATAPQATAPAIDFKTADLFAAIGHHHSNILTNYDRALYAKIFEAQNKSDWSQANALLKRVHDPILVGHVLYQRYVQAKDYKASYDELRRWMVTYGDHPDAYKVYQLAQKRRNNSPSQLPAPQMAKKLLGTLEYNWLARDTTPQPKGNVPHGRVVGDVRRLMVDIQKNLAEDQVTHAYNILGKSPAARMLTNVEYDSLLGEIAAAYYYAGKSDAALRLANQAIKRSDKAVPVAHWIAGLALWQEEDYAHAAKQFTAIHDTHTRNPWMLSAAAFWAARAYERMDQESLQNDWLREAASYPRTFYGLIAKNALGSDVNFSWETPELSDALIDVLRKSAGGKRALALLDIEQNTLAEKELAQIHPNGNQRMEKALVATAHYYKLASLSIRLGNALNRPNGKLYDAALYPVVPWKGDAKTGIDPALVNALIRQESKFDPEAKNGSSGAKGLMQIMPKTARFVSRNAHEAEKMHEPQVNIVLGQRYVRYLLQSSAVDHNLLYMAAAYNAGPGNLERWKKTIRYKDDPFLFIESLPMSETRAFIERVMTNYWIYAQRLDQETETLQALTDEEWPVYKLREGNLKLAAF